MNSSEPSRSLNRRISLVNLDVTEIGKAREKNAFEDGSSSDKDNSQSPREEEKVVKNTDLQKSGVIVHESARGNGNVSKVFQMY